METVVSKLWRVGLAFVALILSVSSKGQVQGLVEDSTIDQTELIQNAIKNSAGKILVLPTGVFLVDRLNLISDLVLKGDNTKLKIVATDKKHNKLLNIVGLTNVTVEGLELDMSNATGNIWDGTPAIEIRNSSNVRILSCYIHDNKYLGVRLGGGNDSVTVADNIIENTDTGIHANNRNTRLLFTGNTISGGTSEGITIYGYGDDSEPSDFVIEKNVIKRKKDSWGISVPFAKNGAIRNNTISGCKSGIGMHDVVSTHDEKLVSSELEIEGNEISGCKFSIEGNRGNVRLGKNKIIEKE